MILVIVGYLYPLLAGTGAIPLDRESWTDGYFFDVAKILGGVWLRWWLQGASALSNMSMFVTEMSSDSYQLLGMAERGMLPEFFSKRSCYGTPLMGILFSASGVLLLSWMSFQELLLCVLHHDTIMRELHAQGRTIAEIAETLKTAPLPANTIVAIRSTYALGL
ncbi:putative polyamine transporter [Canna indica]|uniref:Polyamine transporter n=1 Tax=Canna indica TaxID=4628 RepID=A0AAQ3K4U1_9LILI|nr:putative polyamine transporter [Canna indica]